VLVAAVLGPEEGEDREFEVVRVALEQLPDSLELPVGQTERPVERLFRDRSQRAIVAPPPAGSEDRVARSKWVRPAVSLAQPLPSTSRREPRAR
jgi:hypothetical protein